MLLGAVLENVGLVFCVAHIVFYSILQAMPSMAKLQLLSTCLKNICRYKVLLFLNIWGDAVSFFPETLDVQICVSDCRWQSRQTCPIVF